MNLEHIVRNTIKTQPRIAPVSFIVFGYQHLQNAIPLLIPLLFLLLLIV